MYPHRLQLHLRGHLERLEGHCNNPSSIGSSECIGGKHTSMRTESGFVACAPSSKAIAPSTVFAVYQAHELGRCVAVVIRRSKCVACDVPARTEDQEVGEGSAGCLGFGGKNAEDGGVDVVLGKKAVLVIDEYNHAGRRNLPWRCYRR